MGGDLEPQLRRALVRSGRDAALSYRKTGIWSFSPVSVLARPSTPWQLAHFAFHSRTVFTSPSAAAARGSVASAASPASVPANARNAVRLRIWFSLVEEERISPVKSGFDHTAIDICGSRAGIHLRTLAVLLAARSI